MAEKEEIKQLLKNIDIEALRRKVIDHYDIEIDNEKTPKTWKQKIF